MLNLPCASSRSVSLQQFYDILGTHTCGLNTLEKSHESYGGILVPIVYKKLPVELKKCPCRGHSNKEWTWNELCKAIFKEVEILEASRRNSDPHELPNSNLAIPTASFLQLAKAQQKQGCVYCKGKHNSLEWTVVKGSRRLSKSLTPPSSKQCFHHTSYWEHPDCTCCGHFPYSTQELHPSQVYTIANRHLLSQTSWKNSWCSYPLWWTVTIFVNNGWERRNYFRLVWTSLADMIPRHVCLGW